MAPGNMIFKKKHPTREHQETLSLCKTQGDLDRGQISSWINPSRSRRDGGLPESTVICRLLHTLKDVIFLLVYKVTGFHPRSSFMSYPCGVFCLLIFIN